MPAMNKKTLLLIAGGTALVLLFMYMRSRSGGSAPADTIGTTGDQQASDYADLAGQIQQGAALETGDFANLQGMYSSLSAQEASDIAALNAQIANIPTPQSAATSDVPNSAETAPGRGAANPKVPGSKIPLMPGVANAGRALASNKIGVKKLTSGAPHTNANHPAGTARSAVAQRNHGVQRKQQSTTQLIQGLSHPATHTNATHPKQAPPPRKQSKPPPKRKR